MLKECLKCECSPGVSKCPNQIKGLASSRVGLTRVNFTFMNHKKDIYLSERRGCGAVQCNAMQCNAAEQSVKCVYLPTCLCTGFCHANFWPDERPSRAVPFRSVPCHDVPLKASIVYSCQMKLVPFEKLP